MALNFRKFLDGIRIIPKTTSTASEKGDLEVDNATGKLNYHNGSSLSPVVTETQGASQLIVSANSSSDAVRITQVGSGNALLVEDSASPDATPFVITATGLVGVGTASPNTNLQVIGQAFFGLDSNRVRLNSSAATGIIEFNSTEGKISNNQAGGVLTFAISGGTERVRIDSAGNVGIGTASALGRIHLSSSSSTLQYIDSYATTPDPAILFRTARGTSAAPTATQSGDSIGLISARGYGATGFAAGSRAYMAFLAAENWTDSAQGTVAVFRTTATGTTTTSERLRIDSSGNVGIGIAAPAARLHVANASLSTTYASSGGLPQTLASFNNSDTSAVSTPALVSFYTQTNLNNSIWYAGASDASAAYSAAFVLGNRTGSSAYLERLRIDSAGNVGIGETTPSYFVHVRNNQNANTSLGIQNTTSGTASLVSLGLAASGSFGQLATFSTGFTTSAYLEALATTLRNDTGNINIAAHAAGGTIKLWTGGANERLRITSTGLIGIATTVPATTLDLNGTLAIRFSNNVQTGTSITLTAPTTSYVRLTAAVTSVGGIAGGVNGQRVVLVNRTGSTISINHEDAAVTAANRIVVGTAASFNLPLNGSIEVVYDSTTSRWVVVGAASATTLVTTVSVNTVLTSLNDVVLVNASGGARTITLPAPVSGKRITVKKTDASANAVTISRSSTETIDGNSSVSLSAQYDSYTVISDGTNWFII